MSLLYELIIRVFTFLLIFLPVSYGEALETSSYDKGFLAEQWSDVHDVVFGIIVIVVVLLIMAFMRTPDDTI